MERLNEVTDGNDRAEREYDTLCDSWYLTHARNDAEAIATLITDLNRVEVNVQALGLTL